MSERKYENIKAGIEAPTVLGLRAAFLEEAWRRRSFLGNPDLLLGFKSNMGQSDGVEPMDWTGEPGAVLLAPAGMPACSAKRMERAPGR